MGVVDIFSKRQRRMRGEFPDVYQYVDLPDAFRTQVVFILADLFSYDNDWRYKFFQTIRGILAREFGVFSLHDRAGTPQDEVTNFFLNTTNVDDALSVIELSFRTAVLAQAQGYFIRCKMTPHQAVEELNTRFKEHGIGYQFESNEIVRIDSKFLHQEAVKPALQILKAMQYAGANEEFRKAHGHYRHRRHSEAINECLKALESTLKVICHRRKWRFDAKRDTASPLLDIVFEKGLLPDYLQASSARCAPS